MDRRTMIVILAGLLVAGSAIWMATNASMQNAKTRADAQVTKYQEQTRRAEGRHDLVDLLGWARGRK